MYKVFFVDDEASMRTGIRDNIDWDNSPFSLAGEASDGETALSLLQDTMPDILITDIKMPFMDGIELAAKAKKTLPWLKVIILSGHGEFEYAKQAISLGIEEYLLKPITSSMLMESLNKVALRIEADKEKLRDVEQLRESSKKAKGERLLSDLLQGGVDPDAALELAEQLKLPLAANGYLVMCVELHIPQGENRAHNVRDHAFGILEGWSDLLCFRQGPDMVMCILKGADPAALLEDAYTYAQAVKYKLEQSSPCAVSVSIGSVVADIRDWPKSLAEANMVRRYQHLTDKHQIISMQDVCSSGLKTFGDMETLHTADKLRYLTHEGISAFLEEAFGRFNNTSVASFLFVYYVYVDIMMAASKIITELGGDPDVVISDAAGMEQLLRSGADVDSIKAVLSSCLNETVAFKNARTDYKYSDLITKAKEYIQHHYAQQGISLHSVAKVVNISPNHFCTVFSQETGETFINHLTRVRLERAKTLLETTKMRTSDIAYDVGYNDTHYFSYVFKKNLGLTPKEYRQLFEYS